MYVPKAEGTLHSKELGRSPKDLEYRKEGFGKGGNFHISRGFLHTNDSGLYPKRSSKIKIKTVCWTCETEQHANFLESYLGGWEDTRGAGGEEVWK